MTFQGFLTLLAELVAIGSIALYGSLFLDGLMKRHRPVPGQLEIDFSAVVEPEPAPIAPAPATPIAPEQPRLEFVLLPFKRPVRKQESAQPQAIDLSGYSIRQLKAIASAVKLPRYNVEPKGRLAVRLVAEVERDRLAAALAEVAA